MKTIAIIESCDTKAREAAFMKEEIEKQGVKALVIDVATGPHPSSNFDVPRDEVIRAAGVTWEEMAPKTKGEKIDCMKSAVALYVKELYRQGKIDGVIAAGGLQNTVMATGAMKALPIGFPKVMATTVSSGKKTFDMVVGDKDILVVPSISDFTGLNILTRQIMSNACAACVGMVKNAGEVLQKGDRPVVGITLMGVTNDGCCAAIDELERLGIEVIGFHATGVGGMSMEKMAEDGLIDGILDMTVHEVTSYWFGGGFSYGDEAGERLVRSVKAKVPLVVCPGGLDFVDYDTRYFPKDLSVRKYMLHNGTLAHIKLLPEEAEGAAEALAEKLEKVDYPIRLLLPTDGMRHNTRKGEVLFDPETDRVILDRLTRIHNPNIRKITVPGNLDTEEWGVRAAHFMVDELKERGVIGDEVRY